MKRYYLYDVFTTVKYGGNQLAIFDNPPDDMNTQEMQKIANELKLAETVFVFPTDAPTEFRMRIFTPATEMPTAGHPTIGTAFFVARKLLSQDPEATKTLDIIFHQKVGKIPVSIDISNGKPHKATMQQPCPPPPNEWPVWNSAGVRQKLANLLGITVEDLHENPITTVSCGNPTTVVQLKSVEVVQRVNLRLDQWDSCSDVIDVLLYVFAVGGVAGGDVHGRMFAPEQGVVEDAATGSANGPLACYIWRYGVVPLPAVSEQGFEMGRPSFLHLDIDAGGGEIQKVLVGGSAVAVGEGTFY